MGDASRHDAWQAGASYDAYMGRWSRLVAPRFLDWLGAAPGLEWLDVGCGTGALSAAILDRCAPASLLSIDASEGFVATARKDVADEHATFRVGDAELLGEPTASRDVAVSGLVLNFVPRRVQALSEMKRVVRPGGTVGFYVWDYPGGGVQFMRAFWHSAAVLDPAAEDLAESRRFPFCTAAGLQELAVSAGLAEVDCTAIEVPTVFRDFEDFWRPFSLGAGPAPGYCMSLPPAARQRLKERLKADLRYGADGTIAMTARAWAIRARPGL